MFTKTLLIWALACAVVAARPGDLDRNFSPELRAWVAPDYVTLAADGRAWIGGGFERANGFPLGDLVKLGTEGGVANEPAPGYLAAKNSFSMVGTPASKVAAFLLADGGFLLPDESGGWLRMTAAGVAVGKAFPDRLVGEVIHPQFERDGKLWVSRSTVDGRRVLERRRNDGQVDSGFSLAATDVLGAVPGPDGSVWVLAGELDSWNYGGEPLARRVFRVDAAGTVMGETLEISEPRTLELVAGPAGAFRLVYGPDQSMWGYWPGPIVGDHRIQWYSAAGVLGRTRNFWLPLYQPFAWTEAADGSWLAMNSRTEIGVSSPYSVAKLRRYRPDASEDPAFISPGAVRSVKALAGGKWLVDGLRRLNANGSEDASWMVPELTRSAEVKTLLPLPGGRVLAGGNFAMADGRVRNRLVVFRRDGQVDPAFMADQRIEEWTSLAVSGGAIYVVTTAPVTYGDGVRSNLVKLGLDGILDETYQPQVPVHFFQGGVRFQTVDNVDRVTAVVGGGILVETSNRYSEVSMSDVVRLKADGSQDVFSDTASRSRGFRYLLALADGGFVGDSVIYRQDGSVEEDLTRDGMTLQPLCQWRGGVVFLQTTGGLRDRLRLWRSGGWVPSFRAPGIVNMANHVAATPGETGELYVSAPWISGRAGLRRLLPTGRIDQSYQAPSFGIRDRQMRGNWWKAVDGRKISYDPASHEITTPPTSLLWHAAARQLWTGGNFNVAGGKPRDGLARLSGINR